MSSTIVPPSLTRRWTRVEYERLVELGVFRPGERLELIDGALVVSEPQGSRHAATIRRVLTALRHTFGEAWQIDSQLPIALDACRSSTQPVFEAIACENPYPAAYFPEASFNQMALKAVFTGVALARILGLASRRTPELARMAADYADERRAAGRPVPSDLGDLIAT